MHAHTHTRTHTHVRAKKKSGSESAKPTLTLTFCLSLGKNQEPEERNKLIIFRTENKEGLGTKLLPMTSVRNNLGFVIASIHLL